MVPFQARRNARNQGCAAHTLIAPGARGELMAPTWLLRSAAASMLLSAYGPMLDGARRTSRPYSRLVLPPPPVQGPNLTADPERCELCASPPQTQTQIADGPQQPRHKHTSASISHPASAVPLLQRCGTLPVNRFLRCSSSPADK